MSRFFIRIFLSFWLAVALIGTALVLLAIAFAPLLPDERIGGRSTRALSIYGRAAVHILENQGPPALAEAAAELENESGLRTWLIPLEGESLSAALPADDSQTLENLARRLVGPHLSEGELQVRSLLGAQGQQYLFVAEVRPNPPTKNLRRWWAVILLVINFLATGIVCGLLAWHLTGPLRNLRQAAQRLAAGDLSARSGAKVGRRGDELTELGWDFDRMAERLEALVRMQQELLRDISHELRSPLARVNVALELARRRAGPGASEPLDRIERESGRLDSLIGQLLTLTRLQTGSQTPAEESVDMEALIEEIAGDAAYEASHCGKGVRFRSSGPLTIRADREMLRQAVENVVRNAIRYTGEGTAVEIDLERDDRGFAVVSVRDHGPGVPREALPHLFRPFFRVAQARERQSGGTGIGLAITENAVRLHGGSVSAANTEGGGLVVEIVLPYA